jgi:hypothetical protein
MGSGRNHRSDINWVLTHSIMESSMFNKIPSILFTSYRFNNWARDYLIRKRIRKKKHSLSIILFIKTRSISDRLISQKMRWEWWREVKSIDSMYKCGEKTSELLSELIELWWSDWDGNVVSFCLELLGAMFQLGFMRRPHRESKYWGIFFCCGSIKETKIIPLGASPISLFLKRLE